MPTRFRSTFPEYAGRFRDDGASFGIRWREHGRLCTDGVTGAPVERIGMELDAAFAAYNGELEARSPERRTMRDASRARSAPMTTHSPGLCNETPNGARSSRSRTCCWSGEVPVPCG